MQHGLNHLIMIFGKVLQDGFWKSIFSVEPFKEYINIDHEIQSDDMMLAIVSKVMVNIKSLKVLYALF